MQKALPRQTPQRLALLAATLYFRRVIRGPSFAATTGPSCMHRGVLPIAFALAFPSAAVLAKERVISGPGLHYCAPPTQPFCASDEATYGNEAALAACTQTFNHYIDSVFVYRICLERETKRAVAEANDGLAAFRCRAAGRRKCP